MPSANKRPPNPLDAFPGLIRNAISAAGHAAKSAEKGAQKAAQSLAKTAVGLRQYLVKGGARRQTRSKRSKSRKGTRRTRRR